MIYEIELITSKKATEIIEERLPFGLFIAKENNKYIAIDNRSGDAWTEEFYSLYVANCWLVDDLLTEEAYAVDNAITQIAESIKSLPWYEDESMERCRELAEHQVISLKREC